MNARMTRPNNSRPPWARPWRCGDGPFMVQTNDWDPAVLQRFREDSVVTSIGGGIDHKATPQQIEPVVSAYRANL